MAAATAEARELPQLTPDGSAAPPPPAPHTCCARLPRELVLCVLAALPPNEVALTARLVCRFTRSQLRAPHHTRVRLSQPCPHAEFVRKWGPAAAAGGAARGLTLALRRQLLRLTAASGSVDNLAWLAGGAAGCELDSSVFRAAAGAGQGAVCAWLQAQGCPGQQAALEAAALGGHGALVEALLSNSSSSSSSSSSGGGGGGGACTYTHAVACAAARGGHAGLLSRLLHEHPLLPPPPPQQPLYGSSSSDVDSTAVVTKLLAAVAEGCGLPELQRQHAQLLHGSSTTATAAAALKLAVQCAAAVSRTPDWRAKLEWLDTWGPHVRGRQVVQGVAGEADAAQRLPWLLDRGFPADVWAAAAAARAGRVEALAVLVDCGACPPSAFIASAACGGGHMEAVRLLAERGCPFPPDAPCLAAASGSVEVVEWLAGAARLWQAPPPPLPAHHHHPQHPQHQHHHTRAALGTCVLNAAAKAGSMPLLAWLRARGCEWGEQTWAEAAQSGCEEVLEWLAAQGCPMGGGAAPYVKAAAAGDTATLRCLARLSNHPSRSSSGSTCPGCSSCDGTSSGGGSNGGGTGCGSGCGCGGSWVTDASVFSSAVAWGAPPCALQVLLDLGFACDPRDALKHAQRAARRGGGSSSSDGSSKAVVEMLRRLQQQQQQ